MKKSILILASLFVSVSSWAQTCFPGGLYRDTLFSDIAITDLIYGQNINYLNQTDSLHATLYSPIDHVTPTRPLVIVLYGGSFVQGSRNDFYVQQTCLLLAKRGYLAAAVDYRIGMMSLSVIEGFYAVYRGAQDCKAAVRFFRAHADSLVFDPGQIYMIGYSAGGFNAIHTAFWQTDEVPVFAIPPGSGTFEEGTSTPGVSDTLSGFVSVAGGIGDTLWMNGEKTAVACIHNLLDPVVPYQSGSLFGTPVTFGGSLFITQKAAAEGNFSRIKTLNVNGLHLPDLGSPWADTIAHYMFTYLYEMICRDRPIISATMPINTKPLVKFTTNGISVQAETAGEVTLINSSGQIMDKQVFNPGISHLHTPILKPGIYRILVASHAGLNSYSFIFME